MVKSKVNNKECQDWVERRYEIIWSLDRFVLLHKSRFTAALVKITGEYFSSNGNIRQLMH